MVLSETSNGQTIYYWQGLDTLAQSDGTNTQYFQYDGLGSVRQLTDTAEAIQLAQTFDPYGNGYSKAGTATSSLGFDGEQTDSNGFVFLRARYYSPSLGQFFQTDPSRQEQNAYQYGLGNPVYNTDPSGLQAGCPTGDPAAYLVCELIEQITPKLTTPVTPFSGVDGTGPGISTIGGIATESASAISGSQALGAFGLSFCFQSLVNQQLFVELQQYWQYGHSLQFNYQYFHQGNYQAELQRQAELQKQQQAVEEKENNEHEFYFTQAGPYPPPGRDTSVIIRDLQQFQTPDNGIDKLITQLNQRQGLIDKKNWPIYPSMGTKFEAERVLNYARRGMLIKTIPYQDNMDMMIQPMGTINFVEVKWSNGPLPSTTICCGVHSVVTEARGHPTRTYLLEAVLLDATGIGELKSKGGIQWP